MNKPNKIVISLFALLAWPMLLSAQENGLTIAGQFKQYHENAVNEKLFVHTDKNFYLVGEIVWFKVYYVDGNLHQPIDVSKLAYLEILDKNDKAVLQTKISLSEGSGNGSLYLPVSLNSGVYRLRVYTQWMKNFNADYFFEKPLTVVNSVRTLDAQTPLNASYDIGFFPEGGNLVQNIKTKLAFRITNQWGKGINSGGIVVNQNNDTMADFRTLKFGIGHFMFTPRAGDTCKAIIHINDTVIVYKLPSVQEQGYVMNINKEAESKLRVTVTTNIPSANTIQLLIHTRQAIKLSEEKILHNGTTDFIIDKNNLGEGISHFTIFNQAKQPVCERLYFIRPAKKLIIESSANQQQFSSREKVAVQVISKDETGKQVPADLSVSVYKVDEISSLQGSDISNYLWLTSELKGNIESPGYYFTGHTDEMEEAADNLMLTHGWRRFRWQDILNNGKPSFHFLPEFRAHIINAKITNTATGLPAPDVLAYLSVPGKRVQLYGSKSDAAGRLRFYTTDFVGANEILLQPDGKTEGSYKIEIVNPFSEKFSSAVLPAFELQDKIKDPLIDNNVSVQVQNVFSGDKLKQLYSPAVDSNGFYGAPDNSYTLDDYVRFSTMEEVLREYVQEVLVRRQKENFRLMISGGLENKVFLDDPITLFNGVPVFETNKIMQYDPHKVHRIEVVKRRYFYGSSVLNGIVNFTTYQPDPAMLSGLNAVVFDYEGVQFEREFYSPRYETREQLLGRMPDFRNVLYWSPAIRTNAQGKTEFSFYTSDQKGQYIVVLQGMSAEGSTGEELASFIVK
ncbi:MAG: hypothetical protein H7122_14980 [Chitinophagaceae bacterium]|nr:hypothetical protein [Chitinophagaceae bacterium]